MIGRWQALLSSAGNEQFFQLPFPAYFQHWPEAPSRLYPEICPYKLSLLATYKHHAQHTTLTKALAQQQLWCSCELSPKDKDM
jgi:hypothetical protein